MGSPPDSPRRKASPLRRRFWWVDSAQALKTQLNAKLPSPDCGLASLLSSGQATGTPLPSGCAAPSVPPPWTPSSGRDFPCLPQLALMVTSHRPATPLWKALAQPSSGSSSEQHQQECSSVNAQNFAE